MFIRTPIRMHNAGFSAAEGTPYLCGVLENDNKKK